tara:strand:+ start:383 stop:541 length:159 start_codon:yes stop_codon:yes gene_type:complete
LPLNKSNLRYFQSIALLSQKVFSGDLKKKIMPISVDFEKWRSMSRPLDFVLG